MQRAKKILLSLIFSLTFFFTNFYFILSILHTTKPSWFTGFESNSFIYSWIIFGIFLVSAISSFCWLSNIASDFWIWKIPALLFLPLSIPYLILDYLELKKEASNNLKTLEQGKDNKQEIVLSIVMILNFILVVDQFSIIIILTFLSPWFFFLLFVPLTIILGSIFLILNYFYPNRFLRGLSYCGWIFNWFYLSFDILSLNKLNYFFKPKKSLNI